MNSRAASGRRIVSTRPSASSIAPPWSGPLSVAMAATIVLWRSARVEPATVAPNVDAFMPWSA